MMRIMENAREAASRWRLLNFPISFAGPSVDSAPVPERGCVALMRVTRYDRTTRRIWLPRGMSSSFARPTVDRRWSYLSAADCLIGAANAEDLASDYLNRH
jgi:hypothetical protein